VDVGGKPNVFTPLSSMKQIILQLEEAGMEMCWLVKLLDVKLLEVILETFGQSHHHLDRY
jgi:hypothetical protein